MVSGSHSRTTSTPKWLSLMNNSINNLPFEFKLDKGKIGLDPATIKILPLILKTLKKNKYFHEETSSQDPLPDKRGPTDQMYDKNVFSDTRNWMKFPTSRLYTIEYKTSPIVYFKNPTRNIDYFKKVRKIRDYQRIMNYVDKMISERVTFGSTVPMNKYFYDIHKNSMIPEHTTPMTKTKDSKTKTSKESTKKPKIEISNEKPRCSCPKKMNELLSKLITNLQKLLPNFTKLSNQSNATKPCKHKNNELTKKSPQTTTSEPFLEFITKSYSSTALNVETTTKPYTTQSTTTNLPKIDYTLNAIVALLHPSIQKKGVNNNLFSLKTTTTKNYIEATDDNLENTTDPIRNTSDAISPATVRDYILSSHLKEMTKSFLNYPKEYDDYVETTSIYTNNVKTRNDEIMSNTKGQELNESKSGKRFSNTNLNKEYYNVMKEAETDLESTVTTTDIYSEDDPWKLRQQPSSTETVMTSIFPMTKNLKEDAFKDRAVTKSNKIEQSVKTEDITLEEELEKTSDETAEENIKNLENIIRALNSTDPNNKTTTEASDLYEWELINIEDNYKNDIFTNSIIPNDRSSYLEIQRNDWKPEDNQDFDNNINHYLFQ